MESSAWYRAIALAPAVVALLLTAHAAAAPSVYAPNTGSGNISLFGVDPNGGLTPMDPPTVATGANPSVPAVSPDQDSVYVTNSGAASVSQYDVARDGSLTAKSPPTVATGGSPSGITLSPDGQSAYVANGGGNTISQYDVAANGALTPKSPPTVAAGAGPFHVAVSPDGSDVYVTNIGGGTISQYDVGSGGGLTAKTPATVAAGSLPGGIAVRPDGDSVYATQINSFFVFQYDVDAGGTLSPMDPPQVTAGTGPTGIAISPDGASAYVTNQQTDDISQFDIAAGGALSAKDPAAVPSGDNPFGIVIDRDGEHVYVGDYGDAAVRHFAVGTDGELSSPGTSVPTGGAGGGYLAVRADLIAPTATIDSGPAGTVPGGDARFGFSADEPASVFECSLDSAPFSACTSPRDYAALGDGLHTFAVRATDPWGNTGPAVTRDWTVSRPVPPVEEPPDEPSNAFEFGKVKRNTSRGTAKLTVVVPGKGELAVAGTQIVRAASATVSAPGSVKLSVRPKGSAKRKLVDRGRAKVPVEVIYTPNGGDPNSRTTSVKLKRRN